MKILLTGSNGFLGRNIFSYLSLSYHVDRLSRFNSDINIDLSLKIPEFNTDYDIVIHSAGKAHLNPKSNAHETLFFDVNVLGTQNLLTGLSLFRIPKYFVFISSVSVYGLSSGDLIVENTSLNALDPYGRSKVEAEQLIIDWCTKNNVLFTILRLPLIVGDDAPGNLRSMIRGIEKGYYFNIDGGHARKSMVLVTDISKYIISASKIGGIYNLTDKYHPSFYELSCLIAKGVRKNKLLNIPLWLAKLFARVGDYFGMNFLINSVKLNKITSTLTFDDTAAVISFGWDPTPVLSGFQIKRKF